MSVEKHKTREEWLTTGAAALAEILRGQGLKPPDIRVSCGWPSKGGLALRRRTIGQCWHGKTTGQGISQIFISPHLDDPIKVLATLLHEILHAHLDPGIGHKRPFAKLARACGLEGKPTETHPGPLLTKRLNQIAKDLGSYPHKSLDKAIVSKQTTRLRLWECDCGQKARVASDSFSATCGRCDTAFKQQEAN